jgi:hypothetical protein
VLFGAGHTLELDRASAPDQRAVGQRQTLINFLDRRNADEQIRTGLAIKASLTGFVEL